MTYVNAISLEPVGESIVVDLSSRPRRTKKSQTMKEYKKLAEKSNAKLQVPVYTKQTSKTEVTT